MLVSAIRRVGRKAPFRLVSTRLEKRSFSSGIVQHRDTSDNNAQTTFEWSAESRQRIDTVLKRYPKNYKASGCIPLLWIAQEQNNNFLSLSAMNMVAKELDMPAIRVYETATFYTMFNRTKVGKYHIQLCGTTPCQLRGAEKIKETICKHMGIEEGETSKDGLVTLNEVECLGACANAPMIQVNNEYFYEWLTPENTIKILDDWKAGRTPKTYNQNHVRTAEGPMGKTTLKTEMKSYTESFRDLAKLKVDLDASAAAAAAAPPKA